ncbi:Asp23/Gls24 family envelope stress response protein [Streptomyces globisporus]|uniref:Asp23/Gls24 family envelope stress response protein n=1 Tax=Streptomyces globisporus TaxID=1908 RepID=UPI0004C717B7|nr:Asp23/Gls24 family envelope stress response protein [Streptomyces globisporus]
MTGEADRRPAVPHRERGATSVADRVVAKIAAQVAREALSRFTEPTGHVPPGHRTPHVTAVVRGAPERNASERAGGPAGSRPVLGQVRMRIAVELGYPSDIGAQCAAVRREVTERVTAWAGVEVSDLVVAVERLHSAHSRRTERERVR